MRPIGQGFLKKRSLLAMATILVLASALFTVTSLALLGFREGFTSYLGREEDVLVVYDRSSRTPFTGLVPSHLAEEASPLAGVSAVSPEAIAPVMLNGNPLFVRGVVPGRFGRLSDVKILEGSCLDYEDVSSAVVGIEASRRFDLHPGEWFAVASAMAGRHALFRVKGVFRSGSFLDDEVLVPLYRGQWLRGTDHSHATLIRVEYSRGGTSAERIRKELIPEKEPEEGKAGEEKPPLWKVVPTPEISAGSGEIGVGGARKFMERYLEEFGGTRKSLLALSIAVFLFTGAGVAVGTSHLVKQHDEEISTLRSVGASRNALKAGLLVGLLPWFLLSSLTGLAAGYAATLALTRVGYTRFLAHTPPVSLTPTIVGALLLSTVVIAAASVWRAAGEVGLA